MELKQYFTVHEYGEAVHGTVFMFGGWRFRAVWYQPGIRLLARLGYRTVLFVPKTNLISPRTPLGELKRAAEMARSIVRAYINTHDDGEYIVMGVSLGTLFTAYTAVHTPEISKVVLTSPFGDFKAHVERWQEDRFFRKVIARQPGGAVKTTELLSGILTVEELTHLEHKELYVYYSDRDKIVHTEVTEAMIGELQAHGLAPQIVKVKGGHQTGVFRSYAHVMKAKPFINDHALR